MTKRFIAGALLVGGGLILAAQRFRKSMGIGVQEWPFVIPLGQKVDHRSRKYPIRGVILHHTVTSSPSTTYKVFLQRGVSTHFEIAPDGKVWKYLEPDTEVAYHTGQPGFNDRFIGVDLTGPPYTQAQMNILPKFLEYLSKRYNFALVLHPNWGFDAYAAANPSKVEGVYAHAQVQSNKQDPSEGQNTAVVWNKLMASIQNSIPGVAIV